MSIRTIVAAVSLETDNDPVVDRALLLAKQHKARLVLVHVIENLSAHGAWKGGGANQFLPVLKQQAEARIKALIAHAMPEGPVEIIIEAGAPYELVTHVLSTERAGLLVIGPGRPHTIRERLFGSTADRLVRLAPGPTLVVRNTYAAEYKKVAVAVDFSTLSAAALQAVGHMAPDASVDLVHFVDVPLQFEDAMMRVGTSQADIERYRKDRAKAARKELHAFVAEQDCLAATARLRVLHGDPSDSLVALSRNGRIELLAMGSRGQNIVSRTLLGSVAQRLLHAAGCDLLMIGAPADMP